MLFVYVNVSLSLLSYGYMFTRSLVSNGASAINRCSVILLLAKKEHFVTLTAVVLMHFFVVQKMN